MVGEQLPRPSLRAGTARALLVLVVLGSLVGWFYLTQASQSTTAVIRLHQLASEKERLRQENTQIRYQIALLESISHLRDIAKTLGYGPPQEAEYLSGPGSPATSWDSAPNFGAEPPSEPSPGANFLSRLITHLLILIAGVAVAE